MTHSVQSILSRIFNRSSGSLPTVPVISSEPMEPTIEDFFRDGLGSALQCLAIKAAEEWCSEVLLAMVIIKDYRRRPTQAKAMMITGLFVGKAAPMELNFHHSVVPALEVALRRLPNDRNAVPLPTAFDGVYAAASVDLLGVRDKLLINSQRRGSMFLIQWPTTRDDRLQRLSAELQRLDRMGLDVPEALLSL